MSRILETGAFGRWPSVTPAPSTARSFVMPANSDSSAPDRAAQDGIASVRMATSPASGDSSLSIDMTVPQAIRTLTAEPRFRRLVRAFSGSDAASVLHAADGVLTEQDFQATLGKQILDRLMAATSRSVEYRPHANLRQQPACLYISNHRDIVLDTALLNDVLIGHDKPIPHVAIGDNLLQTDWMVPFYRVCRAFVIQRALTGKQLYEHSRQVSDFVRDAIGRGEPVWMAQRPGRTKDGADKTEPGLLRMLLLAYERAPIDSNDILHVTPVAVSYEIEPCDAFKAASLIGAETKNSSSNRARRDAANIMRGLVQPKGRICLTVRPPILVDNAEGRSRGANRADMIAALAQKVDQEIAAGYEIWSTNYLAHDLLGGKDEFKEHYTAEERDTFSRYVTLRASEILADAQDARNALLSLYSRPVASKSALAGADPQVAS